MILFFSNALMKIYKSTIRNDVSKINLLNMLYIESFEWQCKVRFGCNVIHLSQEVNILNIQVCRFHKS